MAPPAWPPRWPRRRAAPASPSTSRRSASAGPPRCRAATRGCPATTGCPTTPPRLGLAYLRALSLGDADDALLQVFAARRARPRRGCSATRRSACSRSRTATTTRSSRAGASRAGGRLEPQPYDPTPEAAALIRDAPNVTGPITYVELVGGDIDRERLAERRARGTLTLGRALLAGLLEACLELGVQIRTGVRVTERPSEDAVIIATGGFERDASAGEGVPARAAAGAGGCAERARRRAADRDRRGRRAGQHERGLVVPGDLDPGRDDRRRADAPADPRRAHAAALADRRRQRAALRQRGAELQRRRARAAELRPGRLRVPARAGVADLRCRVPRARTGSGRSASATRIPSWLAKGATLPALAASIGVPGDALEATVARFNEGARARRGPGLRPRLLPVRPLHRRARAARPTGRTTR